MPDVHVVGAGPAGSIAALSALRSGCSVAVSEEHASAGLPRNCSGLLSKDGLESLSPYLSYRKHVLNPIRGARIHMAGETLLVKRAEPVAFVCDRTGIDRELAMQAEDEGAKMIFGERVRGTFRADSIIGADGPLSFTAAHFGFPKVAKHVSTLQAYISHRSDDPSIIDMYLSNRLFPGFFAWVIPQDEYSAEFGVGAELPNSPVKAWSNLLKLYGLSGVAAPSGFVIPLNPRSQTAMRSGRRSVLLAGDAAGQVKSTTGGGIVFGGNCAALAGRLASNPLRYELEWRVRFGPDLALHSIIHGMFASLADSSMASLGRRLKKMNIDGYLSDYGHMDKPTRMLRPGLMAHLLRNIPGVA